MDNNTNNVVSPTPVADTNTVPTATPVEQATPAAPVETPAPAPESAPAQEAPAPQISAEEPKSDVFTSGTATAEEIEVDASKPNVEVLDEYEINKDVAESKNKEKKSWTFIIIFFAILFIAIFAFKYIIKYIGF